MSELKWKNLLCASWSLIESIIQQKKPWLQHLTLRLNTRASVNMCCSHTGGCHNVNTAHWHQRKHKKKGPTGLTHASAAVGEGKARATNTCDDRSRQLVLPQLDLDEGVSIMSSFRSCSVTPTLSGRIQRSPAALGRLRRDLVISLLVVCWSVHNPDASGCEQTKMSWFYN